MEAPGRRRPGRAGTNPERRSSGRRPIPPGPRPPPGNRSPPGRLASARGTTTGSSSRSARARSSTSTIASGRRRRCSNGARSVGSPGQRRRTNGCSTGGRPRSIVTRSLDWSRGIGRPIDARIVERMRSELALDPGSSPASYWLAAAARGTGYLDRAWQAAIAGWVRASLARDRGAALRADLDRLATEAIIPERASPPPDPRRPPGGRRHAERVGRLQGAGGTSSDRRWRPPPCRCAATGRPAIVRGVQEEANGQSVRNPRRCRRLPRPPRSVVGPDSRTAAAKPGPEHQRLAYFLGKWTTEGEMKPSPMGPGGRLLHRHLRVVRGRFAVVCRSDGKTPMVARVRASGSWATAREEKVYTYYGIDNTA